MHAINISPVPRALAQRADAGTRLKWLLAANDHEASRLRRFRNAREEEKMLLMRHGISRERAFGLFGLLLGTIPTVAILTRFLGFGIVEGTESIAPAGGALSFLCLVITVVCAVVGYAMGSAVSRNALQLERESLSRMFVFIPLLGAGWGGVTGVSGGFFFFGFGAFSGCFHGLLVGSTGFLMFAYLHRALECGGMIERRHFLPIAFGISAAIAAFIIGL